MTAIVVLFPGERGAALQGVAAAAWRAVDAGAGYTAILASARCAGCGLRAAG